MFVLEPHDTAWDESAAHCQIITSATHRGQKWSVGFRSATGKGGFLIFQRGGGPLLVAICNPVGVSGPRLLSLRDNSEPFSFRTSFADCWNNDKWGRSLFLNKDAQLRVRGERAHFQVILSPLGCGSWRSWKRTDPPTHKIEDTSNPAGFYWCRQDARELLMGDASIIHALLESQWDDPNSDFSFARSFFQMKETERHTNLWLWKRSDLSEMTRVLRWAFLSQVEFWSTHDEITLTISLSRKVTSTSLDNILFSSELGRPFTPPEPLKESLRFALEWFAPTPRYEHIAQHFSLEQVFTHYYSRTIYLKEYPPTAHERLEAALAWRDWLKTTRTGERAAEAG